MPFQVDHSIVACYIIVLLFLTRKRYYKNENSCLFNVYGGGGDRTFARFIKKKLKPISKQIAS